MVKYIQVNGFVEDVTGKKAATVFGKWNDSLYYVAGDGINKASASLLWKATKAPPNVTRYNFTSFAMTLNELIPGLEVYQYFFNFGFVCKHEFWVSAVLEILFQQLCDLFVILFPWFKEKLPPTDSRLRPDQRHLENGEYEKANEEKQRLERRQRMVH